MNTLLLSGGMDSAAILVEHEIDLCLFVDYGQPANVEEARASEQLAELYGIEWRRVSIANAVRLDRMEDESGVAGPRIVPGRNLILLALAASWTSAPGAVYVGCCFDDQLAYPDCGEPFLTRATMTLQTGYGVRIEAPLLMQTKNDIRKILAKHHRAYKLCWSCYTPVDGEPCLECDSCRAAAE